MMPDIEALGNTDLLTRLQTGGIWLAAGGQSVEPLIAALDHPNLEIRWRAVVSLGWIGDARAVAPLVALMQNAPYEIRVNVMWALGQIGHASAVGPLLAAVYTENVKDPDIAYAAALALLRLGMADGLRQGLEQPQGEVYRAAAAALASQRFVEDVS